MGILIFPSRCIASYWFKEKKELKLCLVIEYWWEGWGKRERWWKSLSVFDKRWRIREKKCECVWEGGRGETRKSYLKSQLGNHSSRLHGCRKINFQFQFPCLLCFETLACCWRWGICQQLFKINCWYFLLVVDFIYLLTYLFIYLFNFFSQRNCFLDQFNML